jgi:hypothetical protein
MTLWAPVEQRPLVALDHSHARPHHAGELEHGDTGGERVGGERRAEVVDACRLRNARRLGRDRVGFRNSVAGLTAAFRCWRDSVALH